MIFILTGLLYCVFSVMEFYLKICIHNKYGVVNVDMGYINENRRDLL